MSIVDKVLMAIGRVWFHDRARPVEWLSILALSGWLQVLLFSPEVFDRPTYSAFSGLPPWAWALLIAFVIGSQLFAMTPLVRDRMVRFYVMALATGIWIVIAFNFWSTADTTPVSARTYTSITVVCAMAGLYLAWASKR